MENPGFPGRIHFVCHAAREICNRVPEVVGIFLEDDHQTHLDDLSDSWLSHKLDGVEQEQVTPADSGTGEGRTREIAIPFDVFRTVSLVVRRHLQVAKINEERATRMFEIVAPETAGRKEITAPQVRQWTDLRHWFQRHTHVSHATRAVDERELQSRFDMLEAYLRKIGGEEFYEGVEALDEILEDTNS
jgi:hypothetical protein